MLLSIWQRVHPTQRVLFVDIFFFRSRVVVTKARSWPARRSVVYGMREMPKGFSWKWFSMVSCGSSAVVPSGMPCIFMVGSLTLCCLVAIPSVWAAFFSLVAFSSLLQVTSTAPEGKGRCFLTPSFVGFVSVLFCSLAYTFGCCSLGRRSTEHGSSFLTLGSLLGLLPFSGGFFVV